MSEQLPGGEPNPDPTTSAPPTRPRPTAEQQWRARIAALERQVGELEEKLKRSEELLAQAREALDASDRRRQIERELAAQGAIDLEAASLLTEAAVGQMSSGDVREAVAELRTRRPYLFRSVSRASAMSGASAGGRGDAERAAMDARASGDRGALLRYLRLRRGA